MRCGEVARTTRRRALFRRREPRQLGSRSHRPRFFVQAVGGLLELDRRRVSRRGVSLAEILQSPRGGILSGQRQRLARTDTIFVGASRKGPGGWDGDRERSLAMGEASAGPWAWGGEALSSPRRNVCKRTWRVALMSYLTSRDSFTRYSNTCMSRNIGRVASRAMPTPILCIVLVFEGSIPAETCRGYETRSKYCTVGRRQILENYCEMSRKMYFINPFLFFENITLPNSISSPPVTACLEVGWWYLASITKKIHTSAEGADGLCPLRRHGRSRFDTAARWPLDMGCAGRGRRLLRLG